MTGIENGSVTAIVATTMNSARIMVRIVLKNPMLVVCLGLWVCCRQA